MESTIVETPVTVGTLTSEDLAAMKKANMASFYYKGAFNNDDWRWNGDGQMILTRRIPNAGPLDEDEKRWSIACDMELKDYAEGDERARMWKIMRCSAMEHTCSQSDEWKTFVMCARVGDVLSLQWMKDIYRSGYANDEHHEVLHLDRLNVQLTRKKGNRKIKLSFALLISLCPHNSARMIRNHC